MSKSKEHIFKLPNDTHMSYAWPRDLQRYGGRQFKWGRSYSDYRLQNVQYVKKDRQARLGLWSPRGTQKFVCADFDYLPKGYRKWDDFFKYLQKRYPRDLVVRTSSNKCKILFLLDIGSTYVNQREMRELLKYLLPKALYEVCDTSTWALGTTYLNPSIVENIIKYLKGTPYVRKPNMNKVRIRYSDHYFKEFSGDIPKSVQQLFVKGCSKRLQFIRKIIIQKALTMDGFDLPTTKLAREIGVDQKTIHRWRKRLCELNFLQCVDKSYKIRKKAMTFKAIGFFKQKILSIFKSVPKQFKVMKVELPERIRPGHWHSDIWHFSKYFTHDPWEFINWVKDLPNSQYGGRVKKAISAMKMRLNYAGLSHSYLVI